MFGTIIDEFSFCVYDESSKRHILQTNGTQRDIAGRPWRFYMWTTAPDGIPNIAPGTLLIEHQHHMGTYIANDAKERDEQARQAATLFCAFVQGVVVGWETIEHNVVVSGDKRDQVAVHDFVAQEPFPVLLDQFGLSEGAIRTLCREDLLNFAVHQHQERGAAKGWRLADFVESGLGRLPYAKQLASQVVVDLLHEQTLLRSFVQSDDEWFVWLQPPLFEDESEKAIQRIKQWVDRFREIGTTNDWIKAGRSLAVSDEVKARDPRNVFVVHGRDDNARRAMFEFLRSIDLKPIEWSNAVALTDKPNPYVGEILDAAFTEAAAIVVLLTPDDEARLRRPFVQPNDPPHEKQITPQARANVLFEAGMAMGRCQDRTILVELGTLRPFSDIGGRHVIRLDDSIAKRQELANRLQAAGCPVDLAGTDWHTTGDFSGTPT